jgi:hypothetical protein
MKNRSHLATRSHLAGLSLFVRTGVISLVVASALLSACDVKHDLKDMHDATEQMNTTTAEMNQKTATLEAETGELYDALRQGDSLQLRRNALENLINAKDPARKLSEAGKYFMSFEFQLWSGRGPDKTQEKRDYLILCATQEFFKDLLQFIPGDVREAQPLKGQILPTAKSNMVKSLNALAVTLHMLNPKQEAYLRADKSLKPASMYAFIEEALLLKPKLQSGEITKEKVPAYINEILANEKEAVYLLQARYNYVPALILARTTDIQNSKLTALKMLASSWVLDLTKLNLAQMTEVNMLAKWALETRDFLKRTGHTAAMDSMVARFYQNMKIVDSSSLNTGAKVNVQIVTTEKELTHNLETLRQF